MWKEAFDSGRPEDSRNRHQQDPDFNRLLSVAFALALAMFFASAVPDALFAPVMRELLLFGAVGAATVAALRRDSPFAHEVTGWDQAAILLLLSLVCGLFVDPAAVSATLDQMAAGPAPAAA